MKPLRNIIISNGSTSVELKNDLVYELKYEEVSVKKTMASGKRVKDIVGYRPVLVIPSGYVELNDIVQLKNMINSGEFLRVTYPGVCGDETRLFEIAPPVFKSFKYGSDGVSVWYGVTLKCTAQEVE